MFNSLTGLNLSASCGDKSLNWVYRHPSQLSVGTRYGTSSAGALLFKNIDSSYLLEIQDNKSVSGNAFKNSKVNESKVGRQKKVAPWKNTIIH